MKNNQTLLLLAAVTVGLSTTAFGETMLVDFAIDSNYKSASVGSADTNGNFWTGVRTNSVFDLVDTLNADSGINLEITAAKDASGYNGPAGVPADIPTAGDITTALTNTSALETQLHIGEAVLDFYREFSFTLSGLSLTDTHTFDFFGSRIFPANNVSVYNIYSDLAHTDLLATTSLQITGNFANIANSGNIATIAGITGVENLYFEVTSSNGLADDEGTLNLLRVTTTTIPEPQSIALIFGSLAIVSVTLRRKK